MFGSSLKSIRSQGTAGGSRRHEPVRIAALSTAQRIAERPLTSATLHALLGASVSLGTLPVLQDDEARAIAAYYFARAFCAAHAGADIDEVCGVLNSFPKICFAVSTHLLVGQPWLRLSPVI